MAAIIMAVIILIIAFVFTPTGVSILLGLIFVFLISKYIYAAYQDHQLENIAHVTLVSRNEIFKTCFENTGFSVGAKGNGRLYFSKRNRLQRVEVTFHVTYHNNFSKNITVMEKSNAYYKLLSYVEKEKSKDHKEEVDRIINKKVKQSQTNSMISGDTNLNSCDIRFLDIPFEVLPNEYGLEIKHQSCMIKRLSCPDTQYEINVRCEAHYDSSIKGITNRKIVVSLYDQKGRIIEVKNMWPERLDKSGCKMVSICFGQNIIEEPSKVSVGIERCL